MPFSDLYVLRLSRRLAAVVRDPHGGDVLRPAAGAPHDRLAGARAAPGDAADRPLAPASRGAAQARNREVLLAAGREAKERIIEREFERIDTAVRRDLAECPTVHRRLTEQATALEEDHEQSKEVPPAPPGWVKAVQAVAEIEAPRDRSARCSRRYVSLVKAQDQARRVPRRHPVAPRAPQADDGPLAQGAPGCSPRSRARSTADPAHPDHRPPHRRLRGDPPPERPRRAHADLIVAGPVLRRDLRAL